MKLLDIINKRSDNELQKVHEETFRSIKIFFLSFFCSFASTPPHWISNQTIQM